MRVIRLLNIATLIIVATLLAIAVVLIPNPMWGVTTCISLGIFVLSTAIIFYVPNYIYKISSGSDNNATQIASIGPLSVISICTLLFSASALGLALNQMNKFAIAMDLFAVGFCISTRFIIHAALNVVGDAANNSNLNRSGILQNIVNDISIIATEVNTKIALEQLNDDIRYMASWDRTTPYDESINKLSAEMKNSLQSNNQANLIEDTLDLKSLLEQRNIYFQLKK